MGSVGPREEGPCAERIERDDVRQRSGGDDSLDPGYGFGAAALECALRAHFAPAKDSNGRTIEGTWEADQVPQGFAVPRSVPSIRVRAPIVEPPATCTWARWDTVGPSDDLAATTGTKKD